MRHYCNQQSAQKPAKKVSADSVTKPTQKNKKAGTNQVSGCMRPSGNSGKMEHNSNLDSSNDADIIVPPGCNSPIFHDAGAPVRTYVPSSYQGPMQDASEAHPAYQGSACMAQLSAYPHGLSGKFSLMSIPSAAEDSAPSAVPSIVEYLMPYKGTYICLDLWTCDHTRMEKCGVLEEIGQSFLVIRAAETQNLVLIDLKPIRFISIYCR